MRRLGIVALVVGVTGCASHSQPIAAASAVATAAPPCTDPRYKSFLYFINGRETTCAAVGAIPDGRITSVEVVKNAAAVARFGARASSGAMLVLTNGK